MRRLSSSGTWLALAARTLARWRRCRSASDKGGGRTRSGPSNVGLLAFGPALAIVLIGKGIRRTVRVIGGDPT
jgi:hypothetical protein